MLNKGNASINLSTEKFKISLQMKKHIMSSPFKVSLNKEDKKSVIAYLYAEDEQREPIENYSCLNGNEYKTISKTGHYYIYLYDPSSDSFFPERTPVFYSFDGITMDTEGAHFFVWSNANKKQSDVIFISQFATCDGNQYEAYGFSKNQLYLKKYTFVDKKKETAFYGRIRRPKKDNSDLLAYSIRNYKIYQFKLSLPKTTGEILLTPFD
jgi:hypothetical protein